MRMILPAILLVLTTTGASAQRGPARPAAGFTINITYSPRAAAEMARRNEGLTVAAYYQGEPTRAARDRANEEGLVDLGEETRTIPGRAGPVIVTGRNLQVARLAWLRPGTLRVNVNLYSARRSGPDNILDCGIVEGLLPQMAGRTHQVRCKLIGEP